MCHLNIIIKNRIGEDIVKSLPAFLMGVTRNSYEGNSDGDGIFLSNNNSLYKGKKKVNLYKYEDQIRESNFIITHQRIATSGKESKYIQPFQNKEFILIHNGVITEMEEDNHSDTYVFFKKFIKYFNTSTKTTRDQKIVDSIKETVDPLTTGSYSIAIYDKTTKNLYYFRNYYAAINLYMNPNFYYITTSYDNDSFLNMFDLEFKEVELKEYVIYKINIRKRIRIRQIGKINKVSVSSVDNSYFNDRDKEIGDIFDKEDYYNYPTSSSKGKCVECHRAADRMFVNTQEHVCADCLDEWNEFAYRNNKGNKYNGKYIAE
ncbi:MAG: hypothetical protein IH948_00120 [Bacteroidetes bacterium]|nr:hypothetical protein [Bacteroidota bacterium]